MTSPADHAAGRNTGADAAQELGAPIYGLRDADDHRLGGWGGIPVDHVSVRYDTVQQAVEMSLDVDTSVGADGRARWIGYAVHMGLIDLTAVLPSAPVFPFTISVTYEATQAEIRVDEVVTKFEVITSPGRSTAYAVIGGRCVIISSDRWPLESVSLVSLTPADLR